MTTTLAPQQMELALMSREEAEACVREVRQCARNVRVLLWELQCRRGWASMQYHSFDAFLLAEFDWSANYLHRQMRAAEVEDNIGCAIGTLPESHTRELFPLPTELRRAVWERVGGEEGLTAKRIKAVVAEVQVKSPELPGANGDEPAPPGEVSADCSVCHRHFTETLEPGAVASRTCPKCRAKPSRHGITQSEPASHDVMADAPAPTPPREGDLAAPPTHGAPASRAMPAVTPPPGADLAHGATEDVSRQATRLEEPPSLCPACAPPRRWETLPGGGVETRCDNCGRVGSHDDRKQAMSPDAPAPRQAVRPAYADPDDSAAAEYVSAPASDDLDWLHARDITLAQALTLARRLIVACEAKGKTAEWGIGLLARPSVK